MFDIFFLSLFLAGPAFAFFLLKAAGESLNQVSLVNVTTIALFLFSVLGTLPLYYYLDSYRYDSGIQDKELILTVLLYSCINMIVFLLGVLFARKVVGLQPVKFLSAEMREINRIQVMVLVGTFFLCSLVLILYLKKLDDIALFVAFSDGVDAAKVARSNMGNNFSGDYHWYKLVMHDIGKFLTFSTFAIWLSRKSTISFMAFSVVLGYSVFVAIMATQKAHLAWLIVGLFMTYFLMRNNGFIPVKKVILFVFSIFFLLSVSYIYFMGADNVGSALWSVLSRAFSGSISPAYFYLEFFPENQDYLWGHTFPNPGGLMPYDPYSYTVEVMSWRFPELESEGIVGSAPTVFWGESYANFGPLGVPVVAFLIGCLVAAYSYVVSKIEISPISVGFYVWLILYFRDISTTGFSTYLFNIYVVVLTLLVLVLLSVRGHFRVRLYR